MAYRARWKLADVTLNSQVSKTYLQPLGPREQNSCLRCDYVLVVVGSSASLHVNVTVFIPI